MRFSCSGPKVVLCVSSDQNFWPCFASFRYQATMCRWTEGKRQKMPLLSHQPCACADASDEQMKADMLCIWTKVFLIHLLSHFIKVIFWKEALCVCSYGSADHSLVSVPPAFYWLCQIFVSAVDFFTLLQKKISAAQWITRVMSCSAGPPTPADGKYFVLGVGLQDFHRLCWRREWICRMLKHGRRGARGCRVPQRSLICQYISLKVRRESIN